MDIFVEVGEGWGSVHGGMTWMIQWLMYLLFPKAYSPSSQGDGPNGAGRVCSPAHLPPREPEEKAGHHQLFGGEAAADSRGLCEIIFHWKHQLYVFFFVVFLKLLLFLS